MSVFDHFLFIVLFFCPIISFGQKTLLKQDSIHVYLSYDDFRANQYKLTKASKENKANQVSLIEDKQTKTLSTDELWGFKIDSLLFRRFHHEYLHVLDTEELIIYVYKTSLLTYDLTTWPHIREVDDNDFYFSRTLNSPIIFLSQENLEKEINDIEFTKLLNKELKWYIPINEKDKGGHYLINNIYKKYRGQTIIH